MLQLQDLRHPVVEQLLVERAFTPNDGPRGWRDLVVLTGPNASGKSYLRQIGLIQLLPGRQPGRRNPRIGLDRIFTQVSAVDDRQLASPRSEEMARPPTSSPRHRPLPGSAP